MPLEIRELHIKIAVDQSEGQNGPGATGSGGNASNSSAEPNPALVETIVEKVLDILARKNER